MKKHYFLAIPVILAMTTIVGCSTTYVAPDVKHNLKVWSSYSTENLMADNDYFSEQTEGHEKYAARKAELNFHCMRGENEGAMLMLTPDYFVNSFNFEMNDVKTADGNHTINSSKFSVYVAWYQDIFGSNESQMPTGAYPDALIPILNYRMQRKDFIKENHNQAIYVNLLSPEDAEPGEYSGTGKLTVDGIVQEIPVKVTIYGATMPKEVHQQSCFLIWYDQISSGERENNTAAVRKKYYDYIVSKRIGPGNLPEEYEGNWTSFAKNYYNEVVKNPAVSSYRLPIYVNSYSEAEVTACLTALINENLAAIARGEKESDGTEINFFRKCLFYIDDEPHTSEQFDNVRYHDLGITTVKKSLKSLLDGHPDVQNSFMSVKHLVTTPYSADLIGTDTKGGVQTWCPQFQWFHDETSRAVYKSRMESKDREGGENVWWYGCYDPQYPNPSYHLDAPLILSRAIRYMQYDFDVQGSIYWCVNYYGKHTSTMESGRDIWYDSISWEDCAGDGYFLYPGIDYGIEGPIGTLRLESALASNEEYEYLYMIEQKVNEYNKTHTPIEFHSLMKKHFAKIFNNTYTVATPESFEESRIFLLKVLEKLNENIEQGIEMLKA